MGRRRHGGPAVLRTGGSTAGRGSSAPPATSYSGRSWARWGDAMGGIFQRPVCDLGPAYDFAFRPLIGVPDPRLGRRLRRRPGTCRTVRGGDRPERPFRRVDVLLALSGASGPAQTLRRALGDQGAPFPVPDASIGPGPQACRSIRSLGLALGRQALGGRSIETSSRRDRRSRCLGGPIERTSLQWDRYRGPVAQLI